MVARSRKTFGFAFALLTLVTADAAAQRGSITGRVTAQTSGEPVFGARVTAHASTGGDVGNATTDEEGRYRISVPSGTYSVLVRHVSFNQTTIPNVAVTAGAVAEANVVLDQRPRVLPRSMSCPLQRPDFRERSSEPWEVLIPGRSKRECRQRWFIYLMGRWASSSQSRAVKAEARSFADSTTSFLVR